MNENEVERIAAAINQLRPDWPANSLRTLLSRPELVNRPRRDVMVALSWVACDSTTISPARVIESGPWWRAAAVETGSAQPLEHLEPAERCWICHKAEPRCRANPHADHDFEPDFRRPRDADIHPVITEMKGHLEPMKIPSAPREAK